MSLLIAGDWTRGPLNVPSSQNILWFCVCDCSIAMNLALYVSVRSMLTDIDLLMKSIKIISITQADKWNSVSKNTSGYIWVGKKTHNNIKQTNKQKPQKTKRTTTTKTQTNKQKIWNITVTVPSQLVTVIFFLQRCINFLWCSGEALPLAVLSLLLTDTHMFGKALILVLPFRPTDSRRQISLCLRIEGTDFSI